MTNIVVALLAAASLALGGGLASAGSVGTPIVGGTASYVASSYGDLYLALPDAPRGTLVEVCGAASCVTRRSTDVGPDQSVFPDRVADLSARDFTTVSGLPLSAGLCRVTVEYLGSGGARATPPPTDTEG